MAAVARPAILPTILPAMTPSLERRGAPDTFAAVEGSGLGVPLGEPFGVPLGVPGSLHTMLVSLASDRADVLDY